MKRMAKKTLSLVLAMVFLLALLPTGASADTIVMTADQFVACLKTALSRNTTYISKYPYNLGYYDGEKISWDCSNLGKSIIWSKGSIVNNYTVNNFQRVDTSCGLGDWSTETIYSKAPNPSTDFSSIIPGEWLYMSGHIGYYIGDGQVVECTTGWGANAVIKSQIDKNGNRSWNGSGNGKWIAHWKAPWIDYSTSASSVIAETYPSYCTVTITKDTGAQVWSIPCSNSTDDSSVLLGTLTKGTTVDALEMCLNKVGNYYYKISYNGADGYIWCNYTKLKSQKTNSVSASGGSAYPNSLPKGSYYDVNWKITSSVLAMTKITGYIKKGSDGSGGTVYSPSVSINSKTYQLGYANGDPIDSGLKFNLLEEGNYLCYIEAITANHWWDADHSAIVGTEYCDRPVSFAFTVSSSGSSGPSIPSGMILLYETSYTGINVSRGNGALVVYNNSGATVDTNEYGLEVAVNSSGVVTATRPVNSASKLTVPSGGFVLSGHQGWDDATGEHTGGGYFVDKIINLNDCRVVVNTGSGKVQVYAYPDTFSYKLDSNGNATITAYTGSDSSVSIPSSIDGHPVKAVTGFGGYGAFTNTRLIEASIPNGVTLINSYAFAHCSNLTSITIPSSVTSINFDAFKKCSALTHVYYDGTQEDWNSITFANGNECLTSATIHFAEPLTITSLKANKTSAAPGAAITWTAAASGGAGTLQYCFYIFKDGTVVQRGSYGSANTVTFTASSAGVYYARVYVKDASGTAVSLNSANTTVASPVAITSLKANKTSAAPGAAITWTAAASGGAGTLQYCFYIFKDGTVVQRGSYGTAKTVTFTASSAGVYTARVYVKDASGNAVSLNSAGTTVSAPLAISSIKSSVSSTMVGNAVTWTATATGGSGTLQYCFYIFKDGKIQERGEYGAARTRTFTPTSAGTWTVRVYVKDASGTVLELTGGAVSVTT